ncbi:MAG: 50S ribosomal protein L18Ae [Candidatus Helarchaeota archaeon]
MSKSLKNFQIEGFYKKQKKQFNFKKVISAQTKNYAIEKVLSIIGSKHKVKRYNIEIIDVKEIE